MKKLGTTPPISISHATTDAAHVMSTKMYLSIKINMTFLNLNMFKSNITSWMVAHLPTEYMLLSFKFHYILV